MIHFFKMLEKKGYFSPRKIVRIIAYLPRFFSELSQFKAMNKNSQSKMMIGPIFPVDARSEAGITKGHYVHQDLWAARKVFQAKPEKHYDIGSRIDGFITHLLTFRSEIYVIDIRPLNSPLKGLNFVQADATRMNGFADNSVQSISTLHAAEHFGLGKYGDPIDPDGHLHFCSALERILAPGGRLYFSVPVGRPRIEFNSARILDPTEVPHFFKKLRLVSFSCVDDKGNFVENASPQDLINNKNSCGLYEFTKDSSATQ